MDLPWKLAIAFEEVVVIVDILDHFEVTLWLGDGEGRVYEICSYGEWAKSEFLLRYYCLMLALLMSVI